MDKIIIKEALFRCSLGLSKEERNKKQEVLINAVLFVDTKKAGQEDDIKQSVNYSEVHGVIKDAAENNEYRLIEAMAEKISAAILNRFGMPEVMIKIEKPRALANRNVASVSVEITRKLKKYNKVGKNEKRHNKGT